MKSLQIFAKNILSSPVRSVVLLFLIFNVTLVQNGSVNVASRLATLSSMKEDHSFKIDSFVAGSQPWTIDWAQGPNGHYYSNKAPGPMLLGYPLFYLIDAVMTSDAKTSANRNFIRYFRLTTYSWILSLFLQVLPFVVFVLWSAKFLAQRAGLSDDREGQFFYATSLCFGTTAALFMNSYFGHALAALCILLMIFMFFMDYFYLCGLAFALAFITEYSCLLTAFPLGLLLVLRTKEKKNYRIISAFKITAGAGLPLIAAMIYHSLCFGGPFNIPQQFQNPLFVENSSANIPVNIPVNTSANTYVIGGLFKVLPDPYHLWELLFGASRGILFTQPWVLVLLAVIFFCGIGTKFFGLTKLSKNESKSRIQREIIIFCLFNFILFLWMNASFNGWHGGASPGPRYLAPVLPLFACLAGFFWKDFSRALKTMLWISLAPSVLLCLMVGLTTLMAPENSALWKFYWQSLPSYLGF